MKTFFVLFLMSSFVWASEPIVKEVPKEVGEKGRQFLEETAEEDCEEKAKKPVVIPDEPVLGLGGDAGCSIDDM